MSDRKPTGTALAVAYMRAAHQILDSKPLLLEDAFAVQLLGENAAQRIREASERYQTPVARALRSHIVLRSRYAEDQLLKAVQRGVSQYVVVGAGYDTFSLRQPEWASSLTIVEVDHPATQSLKLARIADAGWRVPKNVQFANVDFECETLEQGLLRNGVATTQQTFFSWLGVTVYLTEAAINETLRSMAGFPAGSQIVLTFSQPPTTSSPVLTAVSARLAGHVESIGEPFISYLEPGALESKLVAAGFSNVEFLSPDEARARYFLHSDLDLPPPKRVGIASALR